MLNKTLLGVSSPILIKLSQDHWRKGEATSYCFNVFDYFFITIGSDRFHEINPAIRDKDGKIIKFGQ